jgi:hypothetical protein
MNIELGESTVQGLEKLVRQLTELVVERIHAVAYLAAQPLSPDSPAYEEPLRLVAVAQSRLYQVESMLEWRRQSESWPAP